MDQIYPGTEVAEQAPRKKRELVTPLLLLVGGVVTFTWAGFVGWAALRAVIYLFS